MARVRNAPPTLEGLLFQTPEQKVLRLLLTESTTAFQTRVLASKLKGVRGLGGAEGINKILLKLEQLGMVDFVDNRRSVRLHDDSAIAQILKTISAVCDLESLREGLLPHSSKAVLIGSRATGKARSDSDYDVVVVGDDSEEIQGLAERHPLGKSLKVVVWTATEFSQIEKKDPKLAGKVARGVVLWGD